MAARIAEAYLAIRDGVAQLVHQVEPRQRFDAQRIGEKAHSRNARAACFARGRASVIEQRARGA